MVKGHYDLCSCTVPLFFPLACLEGSVHCPAETPSHCNLYDFKSKTQKHMHTVIFISRLLMKTTQSN